MIQKQVVLQRIWSVELSEYTEGPLADSFFYLFIP